MKAYMFVSNMYYKDVFSTVRGRFLDRDYLGATSYSAGGRQRTEKPITGMFNPMLPFTHILSSHHPGLPGSPRALEQRRI